MFKISRLTDYSVVILRHLAEKSEQRATSSARDLAHASGLPLPTVSKLLKHMAKHQLIDAKRGSLGGYELVKKPSNISLLHLIEIFDGPPATTTCMMKNAHKCQIDPSCTQRHAWHMVQQKIARVLGEISLHELINDKKTMPNWSME
jgi:FeS assembly SUF system regulator